MKLNSIVKDKDKEATLLGWHLDTLDDTLTPWMTPWHLGWQLDTKQRMAPCLVSSWWQSW